MTDSAGRPPRQLIVLVAITALAALAIFGGRGVFEPASLNRANLETALLEEFRSTSDPSATRVAYQLLRKGPTVTGVSTPKYYAWVEVFARDTRLREAAVRISDSREAKAFHILHVVTRDEIRADPTALDRVFPADVADAIRGRAGVK